MIPYVIYSHTDFMDILEIQTEYVTDYENTILLINKPAETPEIFNQYKRVVYYDDSLPYAGRVLALKELDEKYVMFVHDIYILMKKDDKVVEQLASHMEENGVDRIDLQYQPNSHNSKSERVQFDDFQLIKQDNPNRYIYNVNPSIWKLETLLDVMAKFKNETYRSIELMPTQRYCSRFKVYKLYHESYVNCGWHGCMSFFQFMHITHYGKLLPLVSNNLHTDIQKEYLKIVNKFKPEEKREFTTRQLPTFYHGPSKS